MGFEVAFGAVVYVECGRKFNLATERTFRFESEAEFDFDFGFDVECRRQTSEFPRKRPPRDGFGCPGELVLL